MINRIQPLSLINISLALTLSALSIPSFASEPVTGTFETETYTATILQLAADAELANARARTADAKLAARQSKLRLAPKKQGLNAVERTTETMGESSISHSPIDNVELKSLVTTSGVTTAWIALDGELIEVKKGSKIGALTVIDMNENSIKFSDGHKTKRKWMAGFKTVKVSHSAPVKGE